MFKKLIEEVEKVRGGLSDNMTVEQIAEKHGVSVEVIEMQIEKGKEIEMEHTDDEKEAIKVTMDHLVEIPDYYDRLIKMEKDAEEELKESMLLLTEAEKEVKNELQKARDFFGGKKVEGVDTNRFVRLWNMIRDNFKMELKVFLKLLNPLNWPKAIFMNFYNITKSIATLGTRENESLKIETQRFLKDIADGKYKGKSAKDMFADYNEIRKEYGFKPYTFLQENVIRTDFNGELNRDFDGNVIDISLEEEIDALNENINSFEFLNIDSENLDESNKELNQAMRKQRFMDKNDPDIYINKKSQKINLRSYGELLLGLTGGVLMSLILPFGLFKIPKKYTKLDFKKFQKLQKLSSEDRQASALALEIKLEFKKEVLNKEKISKLFKEYKTRLSELKKSKNK
jgi:hypothetical protein